MRIRPVPTPANWPAEREQRSLLKPSQANNCSGTSSVALICRRGILDGLPVALAAAELPPIRWCLRPRSHSVDRPRRLHCPRGCPIGNVLRVTPHLTITLSRHALHRGLPYPCEAHLFRVGRAAPTISASARFLSGRLRRAAAAAFLPYPPPNSTAYE